MPAPLRKGFFVSIEQIQDQLRERAKTAPVSIETTKPQTEPDYWNIPIDDLEKRYKVLEQWMVTNKDHPKFHIAQIRIQRMNKVLASHIKM